LTLGETLLVLGIKNRIDELVREFFLLRALGDGDRGTNADGTLLGIGSSQRQAVGCSNARAIRVPNRHVNLVSLEQGDDLIRLRIEKNRRLRQRLDLLDARRDVLERSALHLVQRSQELPSGCS